MLETVSVTMSLQITPSSNFWHIWFYSFFKCWITILNPVEASQIFKCDLNMQAESGSKFRLRKLIRCDHIKYIKVYNTARALLFSTCLLTVQWCSTKNPGAFFPLTGDCAPYYGKYVKTSEVYQILKWQL